MRRLYIGTYCIHVGSGSANLPPGFTGQSAGIGCWVLFAGWWYKAVEKSQHKVTHQAQQCDGFDDLIAYAVIDGSRRIKASEVR